MINENSIDFFNSRLTFDYTKVKDLSPAQRDRIRNYGTQAENLLKNRELAMFIHHHKFEITDAISQIRGNSEEDNGMRIMLAHELTGMDNFIHTLKKAVYLKNKIGNVEVDTQS